MGWGRRWLAKYKFCSGKVSCVCRGGGGSKKRWLGADPKPRRRWAWVTIVTGADGELTTSQEGLIGLAIRGNGSELGGSIIRVCVDETRREDGWMC